MKIPEYLNKKAVLEWLNHEIKDDNWAQFSAERALRDVRNFVESGAFDADESDGTWKATAEVLVRENAQMNSEIQRLRAALEEVYEELKALHFMIDHDDIFQERKKKYLSIIDYVGQSVAGQALSTTIEPNRTMTDTEKKIAEIREKHSTGHYNYNFEIRDANQFLLDELELVNRERDKLIEGLRKLAKTNAENISEIREWKAKQNDTEVTDLDWYNYVARNILKEIGVTVE